MKNRAYRRAQKEKLKKKWKIKGRRVFETADKQKVEPSDKWVAHMVETHGRPCRHYCCKYPKGKLTKRQSGEKISFSEQISDYKEEV